MKIKIDQYSRFLDKVAENIDIPPGKYQDAVNRYQAVGRWLEDGDYPGCSSKPNIYPQGSFALGTVVRPLRGGVEVGYDIDLVSELPINKELTTPHAVKKMVGDRLQESDTYQRLLDDEGKRCWTLEYSEKDEVGFHLDVLPCIPNPSRFGDTSVALTTKKNNQYSWSASNPKGYALWFNTRNQAAFDLVRTAQKRALLKRASVIYSRVDDVPDQLVRTPLQRSVQIMKRHRDVKFNNTSNNDFAPISIIITTLAAHFYQNEPDTYSALRNIVTRLHSYAQFIENDSMDRSELLFSPIKRTPDGWYIGNPADPKENFADRWHEDNHARARAFFKWVANLNEDLLSILDETRRNVVRDHFPTVLGAVVTASILDLITPVEASVPGTPKIHISNPPKPWRMD